MGWQPPDIVARAVATRRANQTHCKWGHEFTESNTYWFRNKKTGWRIRTCRACTRRRNGYQESPKSDQIIVPVPHGLTIRQIRARLAAQTTRQRYGITKGNRDLSAAHEARRLRPRSTQCKHGHTYSARNTYWHRRPNGRLDRICRTCRVVAKRGRPDFVEVNGIRVSIFAHDTFYQTHYRCLRNRLIASHPDKGGNSRQFIEAKRRLDLFLEQENEWYKVLHLDRPALNGSHG
jgi:hypothetical protein